jgi:hypothetical protein
VLENRKDHIFEKERKEKKKKKQSEDSDSDYFPNRKERLHRIKESSLAKKDKEIREGIKEKEWIKHNL